MPRMKKGDDVREANSPYIVKSLKAHGFVEVDSDESKDEPVTPPNTHIPVEGESETKKVKVRKK